jgi:hypothetical protein
MAKGFKTGGRTKGTPNKTTTQVKQALNEAFEQMGGVPALVEWGQENPTEFYKLWVKILPVQTNDGETGNAPIGRIEVVTVGQQNTTDKRD